MKNRRFHWLSESFRTYLRMLDSTANPSRRRRYCSMVMSRASSGVFGHWNRPSLRRSVNRQKPIPSKSNPLIRSFFTPQKRNRVPSSRGSRPYARRTMAARPSIPLRRSVLPQARTTRRIPPASLSMLNRREDHGQGSLTGCVSDVDLALPELNHGLRRKRRVRIVRRIRR